MRSGLAAAVAVAEDRQDRQDRKDRRDLVDRVASLVASPAAFRPGRAAAMTMTVVMTVVDHAGREIGPSAHKAPIQRERTRRRNQREMRSAPIRGITAEALVRVHLQQLLHNREEFSNLSTHGRRHPVT